MKQVITINNQLSELTVVYEQLKIMLNNQGVDHQYIYDIQLMTEEVLSNIISYGYDDEELHHIMMTIDVNQHDIMLVFQDNGMPFNPLAALDPPLDRPIVERKIGGLGIFMVKELSDHVEYQRFKDMNILSIKKCISP